MKFLEGFSGIALFVRTIKYSFFTGLNILIIRYTSARAEAHGDTDLAGSIILLISLVSSVALLADAVNKLRKGLFWDYLLYFVFCLVNLIYFAIIYLCCIPIVGAL